MSVYNNQLLYQQQLEIENFKHRLQQHQKHNVLQESLNKKIF